MLKLHKQINDNHEENIRRKKDKKIARHFDVFINGQKCKIVKFLVKEQKTVERAGKTIQLISKFDIPRPDTPNVKITIEQNGEIVTITGDFRFAWWGVGQFYVEYWINEIAGDL